MDAPDESALLLKQLTVGTVVDGKYKIDEIIGRGAMGVVVAATHVHLKERVALKFLSARQASQTNDFQARFRREAQVSAKLRNEHITRVIDVGVWRDLIPFMVMDHLVGNDLRRTLKLAPGGRLPVAVALDYIVQICEGLAEAHAIGIVHRDLKPSNLFVTKRPDGSELIKILDFGISKWSQGEEQLDELTQTGVVLGSPKYMAPEQLFGSASVDARADVWSIGAIFYEMLTGRPPYDFPTLTRICAELATDKPPPALKPILPDLPDGIEAVVMQCFARDREQRMNNVATFAGALLEAVDAPFAGQVRSKIAAVLDPKSQKDFSTTTSSGALPLSTGNYRSLSLTGSGPRLSSSGALRVAVDAANGPASSATAGGVEASVEPTVAEGKKKVVVISAVVGVVVAIGAFVLLGGSHPSPAPAPLVTAAPAQQPPAPPQTAVIPPAPAPADTASAAAAAAASAAASAAPSATPAQTHGVWHGHHGGGAAPPRPAPPPATTPAATPTPAPAPPSPAPAPQPTTKANPLEDRQ